MTVDPGGARRRPTQSLRLDADPEQVGRGLGQLVIAVLELVRGLLERQAIRRLDHGDLTADQVERLGLALIAVRDQLAELRESLGVDEHEAEQIAARTRRLFDDSHFA